MSTRAQVVAPWCALATLMMVGCASEAGDRMDAAPLEQQELTENEQALASKGDTCGTLLRADFLRSATTRELRRELADEGFDTGPVQYGVELYRLIYTTPDPQGKPVVASGLLVLPKNGARSLELVSYAHGTELFKGDAPSFGEDVFIIGAPLTYGSAGYAVVAPDYVGLGVGKGPHPYMHLPTEVSASLDMLKAAKSFVSRGKRTLARELYVTGFSQGSLAALGLARHLETTHDSGFTLAAVAPISGPYQLRSWLRAAFAGDISPKDATMYLAYVSVAWNRIYGIYGAPSAFFRAPYAGWLEPLLDNTHEGQELAEATPDTPAQLFTPEAIARFNDPDPVLAQPIDELDGLCSTWTPRAPVRLYAARGDEQVPYKNAVGCATALSQRGVTTPVVDLGELGHIESNIAAAKEVLAFFRSR